MTETANSKQLFEAFNVGDEDAFVQLLEEGLSPDSYEFDEEEGKVCILSNVVRRGARKFVEILFNYGVNPNFEDEDGETPLFEAVFADCDLEIQNLLYRHGANRNHKNKAGNTPLMQLAIRCNDHGYKFHSQTLFNLLDEWTDFKLSNSRDQKLIHLISVVHACTISQSDNADEHICVRYLKVMIRNGLSINERDGSSLTPLHYASMACCEDALKFLLEHGANVEARSISGQTPLHLLGVNSDRPGFKISIDSLITFGSKINDTDDQGRNILHYITTSNRVNKVAVEIVLKMDIKLFTKDKSGLNPLHLCVMPSIFVHPDDLEDDEEEKYNISDVLTSLVRNGALVNSTDKNGLTPLHYSLRYEEKQKVVETLLVLGADVNSHTKTGESALHRATLYPNLLKTLLQKSTIFDVNARDNFGSTAYHWAVYYFETECIDLLFEAGADFSIADNEGRTPADYAIILKRTSLFKSLGIVYCRETYPLPLKISPEEEIVLTDNETENGVFLNDQNCTDAIEQDVGMSNAKNKAVITALRESTPLLSSETDLVQEDQDSSSDDEEHSKKDRSNNTSYSRSNTIDLTDGESVDSLFSVPDEECIGEDHMWCDCPNLRTVINHHKSINRLVWTTHCVQHRQSLANYIDLMLNSKQMGLYVNIEENHTIATDIFRVVEQLAVKLESSNPLFKCEIRMAGSWGEGTKVVFPDEFDFKWILTKFSDAFYPVESNCESLLGYAKFRLRNEYKDTQFKEFVDESEYMYLDGKKVIRVLYTIINNILFKDKTYNKLYIVKYLKTEKGSIDTLSFRWVGGTYKNMLIDIDVVPTLNCPCWIPEHINKTRRLFEKFKITQNDNYSVVLKTPDSRFVQDWNSLFRLSVVEFEVAIFRLIPESILKGYILVKSLPRTLYYPQIYSVEEKCYEKHYITTYLIKTCFLYELEENVDNIFEPVDKSADHITMKWAINIVRRLTNAIKNGCLEPFFVPGANLLANNSISRFNQKFCYESEVFCIYHLLQIGIATLCERRGDELDFEMLKC